MRKNVTHLGKKLFHSFKGSQSSKRETGEHKSHYGRQGGIKLNSKIILPVPVQTTGG